MTETRRWLEARRTELTRFEVAAAVLSTAGALLGALAVGVWMARWGVYQRAPIVVVVAWVVVAGAVAWGADRFRRRVGRIRVPTIAGRLEENGGLRRGSIEGAADDPGRGSAQLFDLADKWAVGWLRQHGASTIAPLRASEARTMWVSAGAGVVGIALFLAAGPTGTGSLFWRPLTVLGLGGAGVEIGVDRDEVRRGDSAYIRVAAPGRAEVTLWTRAPGEPWTTTAVPLDTLGNGAVSTGALDSDRFYRAVSGRRSSETIQVRVSFPAFIADLSMSAVYPAYLRRPEEPVYAGDSVYLPVGTLLGVRGRATVPVEHAAWHRPAGDSLELATDANDFTGQVLVRESGAWELIVTAKGNRPLEDDAPRLHVVAVPDSAPQIAVPVPGADTTAPRSLRQLLVIDARDDHQLTSVEIVSRRVSRLGLTFDPVTETIPLPEGGTARAVLQYALDLNDRGFLPGDTAYYRLRAIDNAPAPQATATREFALYLPAMQDIREAVRDAAESLATSADSLFQAQQDLARETEDLAAEGEQNGQEANQRGGQDDSRMEFSAAEEAGELGEEQQELLNRAQELSDELQQLAESSWEAGITDPEWHKQLAELQELLDEAVTPEMAQTLEELREALEQLDAEAVREALENLAEQQQQMQEQFERSRELFERAALEGAMTTLADDAEDLADRQRDWNEAAEESTQSDSALAAEERAMAQEVERLQQRLEQLQEAMQRQAETGEQMGQTAERANQAAQQMQQAADQAQSGQRQDAQQSGQSASENLDPMSDDLREQRDQMREQWREEVLEMMDRSLTETADLAQRQQAVTERLQRGEMSGDVRGEQAAIREGIDRVVDRLQNAAGKNALVSPNLSTALGVARTQMTGALQELQEATPNTRQAGESAGQALDGLNQVAYALLRNRGDVAGAQSGSGMAEAMEQMAEMAEQQQSLNGETGNTLPLMPQGGEALLQQLQQLAQQQRNLGEELERMDAEGSPTGTDELAEEALQLARELEAGRLDRETIERQEQLFRRMLDAGRTLRSDEEDERQERQSETADQTIVQLPPELDGAPGRAARYPYPDFDQLRNFSPEERRLILDYFRRLNDGRRRP